MSIFGLGLRKPFVFLNGLPINCHTAVLRSGMAELRHGWRIASRFVLVSIPTWAHDQIQHVLVWRFWTYCLGTLPLPDRGGDDDHRLSSAIYIPLHSIRISLGPPEAETLTLMYSSSINSTPQAIVALSFQLHLLGQNHHIHTQTMNKRAD